MLVTAEKFASMCDIGDMRVWATKDDMKYTCDIAKKYHVTVDQLMKWNNLYGNKSLEVGQQLKIRF